MSAHYTHAGVKSLSRRAGILVLTWVLLGIHIFMWDTLSKGLAWTVPFVKWLRLVIGCIAIVAIVVTIIRMQDRIKVDTNN
jgi:hypothetical protein